ncbi:MAG: hypothetical protein QXI97_08660 [Nitrososphaerota archaeon]
MGWDYIILGNTVSAVSLAIFLKRMGLRCLNISADRRFGDISLQPFRADHLSLIGVDPEVHSEAIHTHLTFHGDRYSLENPIHICRSCEVLEEAAAVNELEIQLDVNPSAEAGVVVDCRRPSSRCRLKARVVVSHLKSRNAGGGFTLQGVPGEGLRLSFATNTGSTLIVHYGIPAGDLNETILVQEHGLTEPAALSSITLSNVSGLGLASPLGGPTADILFSQHLAGLIHKTPESPTVPGLLADCLELIGYTMNLSTTWAETIPKLVYMMDRA